MRKMTINRKVLVLMTGTFIIIFSLSFVLFAALFYNREQSAVKEEIRGTFHRLENRVDGYMNEMDLACVTVMCSKWVQQLYLKNGPVTPSQEYTDRQNAQGFLSSFASMYGELNCCIAIAPGDYVKNNLSYQIAQGYDPSTLPWWETFKEKEKYRIFGHNDMFTKKIPDRSVTTYYQIKSIYSLKPIGYFVNNQSYDTFRFLQEMLSGDERVMITDLHGNMVWSNMSPEEQKVAGRLGNDAKGTYADAGEQKTEAQTAGKPESEARQSENLIAAGGDILYFGTLLDDNWNVWILKSRTTLLQSLSNNIYVFFLLIPALLVFALVSFMISKYLTRPIGLCTQALSEVRNENYEVRIPNRYQDEIGDMISGFNDMAANLGHLRELNQTMYKARLEAEFRILQQRINPHFLCNTLEMVNGMILSDEGDNALELIGMLGRMYRYDLGENDIATLDEEVAYLKNYLSILSYKYPDLQVHYEIDQSIGAFRIPKFVCQPLVENTLRHGFREKMTGASLWIRIGQKDQEIFIDIKDNGKGIEPELLTELEQKILELRADQTVEISEHIGLLNTVRRLFLYFGNDCRFDIWSQIGEGTQITIGIFR